MKITDYGIWFEVHEIKRDYQGRQLIGSAWKNPIVPYDRPFTVPTTLLTKTNDIKALGSLKDKGFLGITSNGVGYRFLISNVAVIDYDYIWAMLNTNYISGFSQKDLQQALVKEFGPAPMSPFSPGKADGKNAEAKLRDLYFEKFGIELPSEDL